MRNKKGFTLTEILATLAIIGVIIAIAIPSFSALQKKFKEDYYKSLQETIVTSAKNYYKDHPEEKPTGTLYSSAISLEYLKEKKYVDNVSAYNSNDACTGYVVVVKENEDYTYKACMKCEGNQLGLTNSNKNEYIRYCPIEGSEIAGDTKAAELAIGKNKANEDKTLTISGTERINIVNSSEGLNSNMNEISIEDFYLPYVEGFNMTSNYAEFIKMDLIFTPEISRGELSVQLKGKYSPINISHISLGEVDKEYTVNYKMESGTRPRTITVDWIGEAKVNGSDIEVIFSSNFDKEKYTFKGLQGSKDGSKWEEVTLPKCKDPSDNNASCTPTDFTSYRGVYTYNETLSNGETLEFYTTSSETIVDTGYIITLDANGGNFADDIGSWESTNEERTIIKEEFSNSDESPTSVPEPIKTGHTFDGWSDDSTCPTKNAFDAIKTDTNLYACWKINSYKLTIDPNGGTWNGSASNQILTEKYKTAKEIADPTRTGYAFGGWELTGNGTFDGTTKIYTYGAGDTTLKAKWSAKKITVQFYDGTTLAATKQYTYNQNKADDGSAKAFSNFSLTKTGHTLTHWSFDGTTKTYAYNVTVTNNWINTQYDNNTNHIVKLYAVWTPDTYTINYEGNKFNTDDSGIVSYDPNTSIITLNGTQTEKISLMNLSHTDMPKGRKYNIQLQYISGSISGNYASFVTDITQNANSAPATRVYKSAELKSNTNVTLTLEINDTVVNDNRKNMYVWIYNDGNIVYNNYKFKVVITEVNQYDIEYGSNYTLPSNPTRFGYTFAGWYTEENGKGTNVTATSKVTGNKKLYANWTPNRYALTINPNGGSWSSSENSQSFTQQYRSEKNITNPVRSGYTFTGWTLTGGGKFNSTTQTYTYGTSNATLTASWRKNKVTIKYKIQGDEGIVATTTDSNGTTYNWTTQNGIIKKDGAIFTTIIEYDSSIGGNGLPHPQNSQYMNIKNDGYKAVSGKEWKDANGNTYDEVRTDYSTAAFEHICDISNGDCEVELFVNWEPISYTIQYNGNGNTDGSMANSSHIYGTNKKLTKNAFTKTGYTFAGWATSENGSVEYIDEQSVENLTTTNGATVNLFAMWTPNVYTFSFEKNGGIGGTDQIYQKYGVGLYSDSTATTFITEIDLPTKAGYDFLGYYYNIDGNRYKYINFDGTFTANMTNSNKYKAFSDNVTLYAVYEPKIVTIVFDSNGGDMPNEVRYEAFDNFEDYTYLFYKDREQARDGVFGESEPFTVPRKEGYIFLGYYDENDNCVFDSSFALCSEVENINFDDELTVYAKWDERTLVEFSTTGFDEWGELLGNEYKTYFNYGIYRGNVSSGTVYRKYYVNSTKTVSKFEYISIDKVASIDNSNYDDAELKLFSLCEYGDYIYSSSSDYKYVSTESGYAIKDVIIGNQEQQYLVNQVFWNTSDSSLAGKQGDVACFRAVYSDGTHEPWSEVYDIRVSPKQLSCPTLTVDNEATAAVTDTNGVKYYKDTISLKVDLSGTNATSWDWYTNTNSTSYNLLYNGVKYKYWTTNQTENPTLSGGNFFRRALIKVHDNYGNTLNCEYGPYRVDTTPVVYAQMTSSEYSTFGSYLTTFKYKNVSEGNTYQTLRPNNWTKGIVSSERNGLAVTSYWSSTAKNSKNFERKLCGLTQCELQYQGCARSGNGDSNIWYTNGTKGSWSNIRINKFYNRNSYVGTKWYYRYNIRAKSLVTGLVSQYNLESNEYYSGKNTTTACEYK